MCLALGYFLAARSDEIVASDEGIANPIQCLTRPDVAFFSGPSQLTFCSDTGLLTSSFGLEGITATKPRKGALSYVHCKVTGPRSGVGTGGGAVALMVELMASGITLLPESASLSSCICGSAVRL